LALFTIGLIDLLLLDGDEEIEFGRVVIRLASLGFSILA